MDWSQIITRLVLSLFLLSCLYYDFIDSQHVIVETKFGQIQGLTRSFTEKNGENRDVHMFLGIPYAQPPVKQLRFKPPQPPRPWHPKVFDATQFPNLCAQGRSYIKFLKPSIKRIWPEFSKDKVSEDCLYLNIFVPGKESGERPFPVLFYIHGGTYTLGTPARDKTPGHILPGLYDIILVTIQYRLGPFGFFTTGDSVLPGNNGMLDQVEALTWVNENIRDFGGDPNRITIAGNSAGGSSVGLHILSPLTDGLFQRAIMESGVEFSPFAILALDVAVKQTLKVGRKLLCNTSNSKNMVKCLRTKDTSDILYYFEPFPGPVVDKNYLPDTPENLRKNGKAKNVSVIMGFTKHDGSHMLTNLGLKFPLNNYHFRKGIERTIQIHMNINDRYYASRLADAAEFQYYPWHKIGDSTALHGSLIKFLTDYFIIAPTFKAATFQSKMAATYLFRYSHISKNSSDKWVGHSSNVDYGFGAPFASLTSTFTDEDRNISQFIMNCYINFVKHGNPTPVPVGGVNWTKYTIENGAIMDIKSKPEMSNKLHAGRIAFWNFYTERLRQDSCTIPPRTNKTIQRALGSKSHCSNLGLQALSFLSYLLVSVIQ